MSEQEGNGFELEREKTRYILVLKIFLNIFILKISLGRRVVNYLKNEAQVGRINIKKLKV